MNRKISNSMAKAAAIRLKNAVYSVRIEQADSQVNAFVELLVKKYVPVPVLACVNEFSTYFDLYKCVSITTVVPSSSGNYYTHRKQISATLSFNVPSASRYIKVSNEEYESLLKLDSKRELLKKHCEDLGEQVYNALITLRTEKKVAEYLPEALKYIDFPEVNSLPTPVYTGLRDIISKISS